MKSKEREQRGWERNENDGEVRITDRRRRYLNDDPITEEETPTTAPNLKPSYVQELEARTRAAEQLAQDIQGRFEKLRSKLQQETDETRQRLNRAADDRTERSKAEFIASLLPVLDNLQRAIEAADTDGSREQLAEGVKKTAESFLNALNAAGVQTVTALGEPFNPELQEAVETVPVEADLDGKVITVYTPGYQMGDRLLRPARVAVGRAAEKVQAANDW